MRTGDGRSDLPAGDAAGSENERSVPTAEPAPTEPAETAESSPPPKPSTPTGGSESPEGSQNTGPEPASVAVAGEREFSLQGTSIIGGQPVAVINEIRVFVGDWIGGARVVSISERVVELDVDGTIVTLTL